MHAAVFCIAASILGIEVGWQPIEDSRDEVEFTIQIEPQRLATLKAGRSVSSDLPDGLKIARYRIIVGQGPLPKNPSFEQLQASVKSEKTRDLEEEVAEDLPFRRAKSPEPAERDPSPRRESGSDRTVIAEHKPIDEGEPTPARDPLLARGSDDVQEPADRYGGERHHPFAASEKMGADRYQWNQPATEPAEPTRHPPGREANAEEGRDAAAPAHGGRHLGGRVGEATSEKPLEPTPAVGNHVAEKGPIEGPRFNDPLLRVKPDEFNETPGGHPIPQAQPVGFDDEDHKRKSGDRPAIHKAPEKPAPSSTAKPQPNAVAPHHPAEEKADPPQTTSALTLAFLLLVSLAGNAGLGWLAWGERLRSRNLLEKLHAASESS